MRAVARAELRCEARGRRSLRSCSSVEQNVPVLQVLGFRAVLQVLLQAVAPLIASNGRDGGSVDDVSVSRSHGERWSAYVFSRFKGVISCRYSWSLRVLRTYRSSRSYDEGIAAAGSVETTPAPACQEPYARGNHLGRIPACSNGARHTPRLGQTRVSRAIERSLRRPS